MVHSIRKRASPSGPPLAVVWRRIEVLRPDPANPRSHSAKQIRQLVRSIGAFGFNVPILVDRTLRIVAGHGRLLAAPDFAIETTGFELSEIEVLTAGGSLGTRKRSRRPTPRPAPPTVASAGEWWLLGRHRVGCGNLADTVDAMLAGEEDADVVVAANPAAVDMIIRRWQASTG